MTCSSKFAEKYDHDVSMFHGKAARIWPCKQFLVTLVWVVSVRVLEAACMQNYTPHIGNDLYCSGLGCVKDAFVHLL